MTDLSRRSVLGAAAWTAPVVALAAAAPAYATSPTGTVTYGDVTVPLTYRLGLLGIPITLTLDATVPIASEPNAVVDAMSASATLIVPSTLRSVMTTNLGSPETIGGTVTLPASITGAVSIPLSFTADVWPVGVDLVLAAPVTPVSTFAIPSGSTGPVVLTAEPTVGALTGYDTDSQVTGSIGQELTHLDDVDYTVAAFAVA